MITVVRRIKVNGYDRPPTFEVHCSHCGETYYRRTWKWNLKRAERCGDCDHRNRRQGRVKGCFTKGITYVDGDVDRLAARTG